MSVLVVDYELDAIEVVRLTFNLRWPEAEAMAALTGSEGVEQMRRFSDVPMIMLTARYGEVDKVKGLKPRDDLAGAPMIVNARGVGYKFVRRDRAPSRAGG